MLLRSTSAPILSSWLPQHCTRESSPEPESQLQRRHRSLCLLSSKSIDEHTHGELLHKPLSDNNKQDSVIESRDNDSKNVIPRRQRRSSLDEIPRGTAYGRKISDPSSTIFMERLFSSSGLGEKVRDDDHHHHDLDTLASGGGGGMGSSGGKRCNGGGVGGSDVDGGGSEDATDTYYREIIDLNPGNSLFTANYAKFLKEVRGDMKKAEEYCERAILGNTNDGIVLSLYADLILQNHGDRKRADSYFQQAAKLSPEDCYVQASYARFLWDVEEEEEEGEENYEEKEEEEQVQRSDEIGHMPPSIMFRDFHQHTPTTTPS
ncbi:hypothetical protein EUTSA_v10018894mg [Eutrema salsugineum]|uniref:Uncharacterized protein n=1 Tax=Eutrema salsugineum TaxID=72664 RepID=V4M7G4_EUTSA|nr:uncharacterized protein LOC18007970 [Eutrema salsugineum]ESQ27041.1 hypothetical protein EUTSA_v10018894mg [Eutrema salsugineum]